METQMKLVMAAMFSAILIKFCEAGEDIKTCYRCTSADTATPWCKAGAQDMKEKTTVYIEATCESGDGYCMKWEMADGTTVRGCSKGKDMAYNEEPCQANDNLDKPIKEKDAIALIKNPLDKVYCCDSDQCNGGVSMSATVSMVAILAVCKFFL